jgi:hypothetical protein
VTVYSKNLSSQYNLTVQIKPVKDKIWYFYIKKLQKWYIGTLSKSYTESISNLSKACTSKICPNMQYRGRQESERKDKVK